MFLVVSILLCPIWCATCMSVAPEAISRDAQTCRSPRQGRPCGPSLRDGFATLDPAPTRQDSEPTGKTGMEQPQESALARPNVEDPVMKWQHDARTQIVHRGDLAINSPAEVRLLARNLPSAIAGELIAKSPL